MIISYIIYRASYNNKQQTKMYFKHSKLSGMHFKFVSELLKIDNVTVLKKYFNWAISVDIIIIMNDTLTINEKISSSLSIKMFL